MADEAGKINEIPEFVPACPQCSDKTPMKMMQRSRDKQPFWCCSKFPKCFGQLPYEQGLAEIEKIKASLGVKAKAPQAAQTAKPAAGNAAPPASALAGFAKKVQGGNTATMVVSLAERRRKPYQPSVNDADLDWLAAIKPFKD